jgi:hypothetical protein
MGNLRHLKFDGEQMIVNVVLKDLKSKGPIRQAHLVGRFKLLRF